MNTSIDISIIIINYNSADLLNDCLSSLIKYTSGIKYEIIVVDNCSTLSDIQNITDKFLNIKLIRNNKNLGFAAANNIALKEVRGKYVLFLNNDTIFIENTLRKVFDFSELLNAPAFVGCKLLNSDNTVQFSVYDFPRLSTIFASNFFLYLIFPKSKYFNKYHLMNIGIDKTRKVEVVTGAFLFAHTDRIRKLGGFDENFFFYAEETDLCKRHWDIGGQIYYFSETSVIHLKAASAKKNLWFKFKNESVSQVKYFQKHFRGVKRFAALIFHYTGIFIRIPLYLIVGFITINTELLKKAFYYAVILFIVPSNRYK